MLKRNHVSEETHLENKEKDKNIIIYMTSCKVDTWFELFRVHINFTSFQNCGYILQLSKFIFSLRISGSIT